MNSDLTEIVWKKNAINFTKLMCYQSQKEKKKYYFKYLFIMVLK